MSARSTGLLACAVLLLAGCSGPGAEPAAQPPGRSPGSASASASPSPSSSSPATIAWTPVPGDTDVTVTINRAGWSLAYDEERGRASLTGPDGEVADPATGRVSDALLSEQYAVVVHQAASGDRPATATVTDLATGATSALDGSTPGAPTTAGGTWALDGARAAYASAAGDDYCLAVADLPTGSSTTGWCAAAREGFNAAHPTDAGLTLLSFDDARPSCRTIVTIADQQATPLEGPTACQGLEGVVTATGAVWSEVADEQRIEQAHYHARDATGTQSDLGTGTSGTLVACGASTYFSRDSRGDRPAALMRWDGAALTTAYTARPGQSFLSAPRCGGGRITVSSFSEGGDEQVSSPAP